MNAKSLEKAPFDYGRSVALARCMDHFPISFAYLDPAVLADARGISIEDILAEMRGLLLADVPRRLVALRAAIDGSDVETTCQIAYRLRAAALAVDARHVAEICSAVERAARDEALDRAAAHAGKLAVEFESTRLVFEQELRV